MQRIVDTEWKCIDCPVNFSLCFKYYRPQPDYHAPAHSFKEIEPTGVIASNDGTDDGAGLPTDALGGEGGGDDTGQLGLESPGDLEFVLDEASIVE